MIDAATMFKPPPQTRPAAFSALRYLCIAALGSFVIIGSISAYRAWFQVKSLDVMMTGFGKLFRPNDPRAESIVGIHAGSVFEATVTSYARTQVDVRLELVQGAHSETLLFRTVPGNEWAFFDPRTRQASFSATITDELLRRFTPGRARLRATAVGRPQWTRLPPPVVREMTVELQPN